MYVMPTTVIAEIPTPVSIRVTNKPTGSHTNAFSSEQPAYQTVVRISAFFLPIRSESQPPAVDPTNIPTKVAETRPATVEIERFQAFMMAGAAKENVLMSPMSKKNTSPSSQVSRR